MNRQTKSRWDLPPLGDRPASLLRLNHSALKSGKTIHPKTIRAVTGRRRALKSGVNNSKIGGEILTGKWAGFPVYYLTLEERATCPKTCPLWRGCYGNDMHRAHRFQHGPDLERWLKCEVAIVANKHPTGFAVRLHVLGDFYSPGYVGFWGDLLARHPALHVWAYTARWDVKKDPIATALVALAKEWPWDRLAMRFSNAPESFALPSTIVVGHPYGVPDDAIICPQQERFNDAACKADEQKTESCSTCALCWQTKRRIAFLQH